VGVLIFLLSPFKKDFIALESPTVYPLNIALIASTLVLLPLLILWMRPEYDSKFDAALQEHKVLETLAEEDAESEPHTLADHLNNAKWINWLIAALTITGMVISIQAKGFGLPSLTLLMLSLALVMQGTPIRFVEVMRNAIRGSSDIVVQFPLFGGIMGVFIGSGLAVIFANQLLSVGDADSLPWLAFICSSFVNLFIPSGGGEWLVLGPPLLEAANRAGADVGKTIIAFAYGDSLTNLMNPFWTLTFLPIMGKLMELKTRDFMGYTVFLCLAFFMIESLIIWIV